MTDKKELFSFGRFVGKSHILPARVYFADTDATGIMYHGRYVEFAERGRSEYLAAIGFQVGEIIERFGYCWVISEISIKYLVPARGDDLLEIHTSAQSVGAASLIMDQQIMRTNPGQPTQLLAQLTVKAAVVDMKSGKPRRFDPEMKARIVELV